jgi:hypothetical protein
MELRFHPGQVFASRRVVGLLNERQRKDIVRRHLNGDWNPTCRARNEQAVRERGDVFSRFWLSDKNGHRVIVWVLTEVDRGRTFLMCPDEGPYRRSPDESPYRRSMNLEP